MHSDPHGSHDLAGNHAEHMAAIDLVDPNNATHTATKSGDWFDATIWSGGVVPDEGANVFIPLGIEVTYQGKSDASIFSIGVEGALNFDPTADSKLVVDTLVVTPTGSLEIGTADHPVTGDIEIVIANNGAIDTDWDPQLLSRGVVSLGDVSIHGEEIDSHIKVTTDPMAGDQSITLAEIPTTWSVGDTIVIAGTHNPGHSDNRYQPEYRGHTSETREITSIEGNKVYFAEALEYNHDTPRDYFKTSVANYSRNITIRSEEGADSAVHERGHVMFMGSDDVDVRFASFVELGRTDKSERAVKVADLEEVSFDSNVQGRYSLHLHQLGVDDQDNPIMIEGNSVIGSPGWGITQHSSHANLHNNATLNIWGSAFVSEAGDETGTWTDNISIGNVGVLNIERNHADVAAGDIARIGSGFWMQSRLIETVENVAVAARTGFVWIVQGSTEEHDPTVFDQPEAVGLSRDVPNRFVPIALALDNEVIGSERGLTATKGHPNQHHDIRTMIEGFDAWYVRSGIKTQYTAHYTFKDIELIAVDGSDPLAQPDYGVHFGNNLSDMVLDEPRIDGFKYAYDFIDFFSPSLNAQPGDKQFFVVGGDLKNLGEGIFKQDDWEKHTTLIDPSDLRTEPLTVEVTPTKIVSTDYRVYFNGVKFDSLGEGPLPSGTDDYLLLTNNLRVIAERDGYWTRDGVVILLVEAYYMDRLTGEMIKVAHEVEFADANLLNSSFWNKASSNGELPTSNSAPIAVDDVAETLERTPVTFDILSNDKDTTTFNFKIDGLIQPKHGKVVDNGDGTVTYRPDPGFEGVDSFFYWVTDGYGAYTKGKASVTVATSSSDPDPTDPPEEVGPKTLRVSDQAALEAALQDAEGNEIIVTQSQPNDYQIDFAALTSSFPNASLVYKEPTLPELDQGIQIVFAGSYGHDVVIGAGGNDAIAGGAGLDRLTGGDGADSFVFKKGTLLDIVYDFTDGEDRIVLEGITFDDLEIAAYRETDTMLKSGDDWMILKDTDHTDITAADFVNDFDWM